MKQVLQMIEIEKGVDEEKVNKLVSNLNLKLF